MDACASHIRIVTTCLGRPIHIRPADGQQEPVRTWWWELQQLDHHRTRPRSMTTVGRLMRSVGIIYRSASRLTLFFVCAYNNQLKMKSPSINQENSAPLLEGCGSRRRFPTASLHHSAKKRKENALPSPKCNFLAPLPYNLRFGACPGRRCQRKRKEKKNSPGVFL